MSISRCQTYGLYDIPMLDTKKKSIHLRKSVFTGFEGMFSTHSYDGNRAICSITPYLAAGLEIHDLCNLCFAFLAAYKFCLECYFADLLLLHLPWNDQGPLLIFVFFFIFRCWSVLCIVWCLLSSFGNWVECAEVCGTCIWRRGTEMSAEFHSLLFICFDFCTYVCLLIIWGRVSMVAALMWAC